MLAKTRMSQLARQSEPPASSSGSFSGRLPKWVTHRSGACLSSMIFTGAAQMGCWRRIKLGAFSGNGSGFSPIPLPNNGYTRPDCTALLFDELWDVHASHRLNPKDHILKIEGRRRVLVGWIRGRLGSVLQRRKEPARLCHRSRSRLPSRSLPGANDSLRFFMK